ncbi:inositol monophosphatase family protein [Nocardioides pocheonensis]|uniref:Inositol monophosphatase family protein n=1 Tax=Nocardioides pocheonensis TaxID=661485 RepID=A0A3N0GP47_9ACTN|nr:inositol monophosphatase family protein [Nocardioides pocheonensis]RNM14255.1 inositol monophosphatase family protein [Nocardioides pocheonensis]
MSSRTANGGSRPSSPTSDAEVAISAALAGAEALRRRYGGPLTRLAKSERDFATEADLEAERAVRDAIAEAFPGDAFLGEEGGLHGAADAARTWLVDPLCGTLNFAARTPLVAVNVALREGGGVTAAAIADPFAAEVCWTDGDTAWGRTTIDTPLTPDASSRLVDVDFDGHPVWAAQVVSAPEFTDSFGLRVSSTSLALAWVASGRRAAYVIAGDVRDSVHFAAGIALCRAAGCVVTDLAGEPVESAGNGLIAVADAATHATLLGAIATATG